MGDIDHKIAELKEARRKAEAERLRSECERIAQLKPSAWKVAAAIGRAIEGSTQGRALQIDECQAGPSVEIWRVDLSPHQRLAEFRFNVNPDGVSVQLGGESRRMEDGGADWAASRAVELAAQSFLERPVSLPEWVQWAAIAIIGAITLVVLFQVFVAVLAAAAMMLLIVVAISFLAGGGK